MKTKNSKDVAIALKYDAAKDAAPLITAVGKGAAAGRIIEAAKESGVVQVEDPFQASALSAFTAGSRVPKFLYDLVAEVLLFVEEADMENMEKMEKSEKSEKSEKMEKSEKPEKPEKSESMKRKQAIRRT